VGGQGVGLRLKRSSVRTALAVAAGLAFSALAGPLALAKVRIATLAELVQSAEFIGVVRVDRISTPIPFLRQRRATATVLQSWKGQSSGRVTFVAAPTWICDISDAKKGELAVVFIRAGSLEHAGRGRMPIFTREGRRLAAIWDDVRLPQGTSIKAGPEPEYSFIHGITVSDLQEAVAELTSEAPDQR